MEGNPEQESRIPLDRDRIVRVALELLDEVWLDDLSMQRPAERLNVTAASLYWYVHDKSELLALLADAISAGKFPSRSKIFLAIGPRIERAEFAKGRAG